MVFAIMAITVQKQSPFLNIYNCRINSNVSLKKNPNTDRPYIIIKSNNKPRKISQNNYLL